VQVPEAGGATAIENTLKGAMKTAKDTDNFLVTV
jgi:hypothetical protein